MTAGHADATEDPLFRLIGPERLTAVVDVGANPIDGDPPYLPMLRGGLCRVRHRSLHPPQPLHPSGLRA